MENYSAIYNNMNGIWAHCAKWRKSNRERQILYDLTHMWNIKKILITKKEIGFVVTRSVKWRMEKLDEAGPKVQTFGQTSTEYIMYNMMSIVNNVKQYI